jgi:hypothetical protein
MKLRTVAIVVAVVGIVALFVSGFEYQIAGFPAAVSEAAWPIFLLAILVEIGLGVTALIRRASRSGAVSRS